jgi:DUF4097 and DUF4098 domain-containing protein YvlB
MLRHVTLLAALVASIAAVPFPTAQALPHQRERGRAAESLGQSIDTTFRMDKGGVVDLSVTFGDIIVTGTSGTNVRIRATAPSGRVRLRASATLATLRTSGDRGGRDDVRYEVTVPAGIRVLMHNTHGDLTVTGLKGDLEAVNISGDINITDMTGLAKIESVSGDIIATGLSGGARIETASGDVRISDATGELLIDNTSGTTVLSNVRSSSVRAESVSGTVRFQGAIDPSGKYDFASHSGNIRLALPANTGALLTLSTYNGSIDSEFPITLQQGPSGSKEKELQFRLGSGSARLTAETFSGNIIITRGTDRDRQE